VAVVVVVAVILAFAVNKVKVYESLCVDGRI